MKKTNMIVAVAAAMTVAAGAARAARAEAVPEETTAPVPAISVSEDGELSFAPEFQSIADRDRNVDDGNCFTGASQDHCCSGCNCGCK